MEELPTFLSSWMNPQVLGDSLAVWSGRILAASLVFFVLLERIEAVLDSHGMTLTHVPPPPRIVSPAASSA
jgi:hypothetical protein